MKVLHIITSLERGGAEKLLTDLLPEQKKLGIETVVVSLSDKVALKPFLEEEGIRVITLSHRGTIYNAPAVYRAIRRFRRVLDVEKPDIVHSHVYMADVVSRLSAPNGVKLITTLHNLDPWWVRKTRIRSVLQKDLEVTLIRLRQVRLAACSDMVRRAALRNLKPPPNRLRLVYNGIDIHDFRPERKRRGGDTQRIIQVARFAPQKDHVASLQAFSLVRKVYPHVRLQYVGDGALRPQIEQQAREMGLADSVDFLGLRDDVRNLLQGASIYWLSSRWEGLPIACLEAMACALPVVVTRVGGLPEIVTHGHNGYLVDQGAVRQLARFTMELLCDPDRAHSMGRSGRLRVEQEFTIAGTAANYARCYRDLLDGQW